MRWLVILAIGAYQRFVSPRKGFCCAYRVHTGRCSCSEFGRRVVARKGAFTGLLLIDARLRRCGEVHRERRPLRTQSGVVDCSFVPDGSDACDCADACDFGCDGCDGCDWRRRRKNHEPDVQFKPASRETGPWPEHDASHLRCGSGLVQRCVGR